MSDSFAMLKSSWLPAADVGFVVGVMAAELPATEPLADVEVPLAFEIPPLASFAASRFSLDAEGGILRNGSVGRGGGRK